MNNPQHHIIPGTGYPTADVSTEWIEAEESASEESGIAFTCDVAAPDIKRISSSIAASFSRNCSDTWQMDRSQVNFQGQELFSGVQFHPPQYKVPIVPLNGGRSEVIQKFEGTVILKTVDSFIARLVDKTRNGAEEEAEIPLTEVTPGDTELIEPGAMFYWVIYNEHKHYGQVCKSSMIRFRRIPAWSVTEIERAKSDAAMLLSFLDLDPANQPA